MRWCWLVALLLVAVGCGSAQEQTPPPVVAPAPPPPPPRDADQLARAVVGAQLTAFVEVGRVREHPLASRLAETLGVGAIFEGTGIDPLRDVDRAFVAAKNARDGEAVIVVAEHHVPPPSVKAAMQKLVDQSGPDGAWLKDYPVPAARVKVRKRKSVLLAVTDSVLVVTAEAFAPAAAKLSSTGGLPEPPTKAAVTIDADKPAESLKARRAPPIPQTIGHMRGEVTFGSDGGAIVTLDGKSTSPEQATADAAELTSTIEAMTSVKVSVVRIRMFEPVAFVAEGDRVTAERKVTKGELERLVGLAGMLAGE